MLDLRALGYFVAIHEEGSITAAAARCHIAQPSITNALQGLEGHLGCQLFERGRKGCRPTPEGERLYRRAKDVLDRMRAIENEFRAADDAPALKLHVQPDILLAAVQPMLALLYRRWPGLRVTFCASQGEAELAVVSADDGRDRPSAGFHALWQEDYVMALPANHPLRFANTVGLEALHGLALIDRPRCARSSWFQAQLAAVGAQPNLIARADSEETVLALLNMGVGAAIVPERHLPAEADHLAVVRFTPGLAPTRRVGLRLVDPRATKVVDVAIADIQAAVA